MCGLVGFLCSQSAWTGAEAARRIVTSMREAVIHRGPDDFGLFLDEKARLAIGFRRLSIVDLSSQGHQPMESRDGRYVIAFNGEIYNHAELRAEAEALGHKSWRGHSDTEIMLAQICLRGFEATIERLVGMFAIALWDREENCLWLARDRLGEKPLYYGRVGGLFLFGSELKALRRHPALDGAIDPSAAAAFLRYGYVPDPQCIYRDFRKLAPGHLMQVRAGYEPQPRPYWNATSRLLACRSQPFRGDAQEAVEELLRRIRASVADRLVSDRPVGAFLSGGIDSSSIVAAMMHSGHRPFRTYTVGFDSAALDESRYAEAVAAHLGAAHTSFRLTQMDCQEAVPGLARIYDEPFADASQIPTLLLCRETRREVTVALSGDGGDELFGGYGRYLRAAGEWQRCEHLPSGARRLLGMLVRAVGAGDGRAAREIRKTLGRWTYRDADSLYRDHQSRWRPDDGLYNRRVLRSNNWYAPIPRDTDVLSLPRRFMLRDLMSYLPGDLLVKMDRASMAFGLEVRAPLLDHRLVEFVWSLPDAFTVADGAKGLLRKALTFDLPTKLFDRPKQGFEPPLADWLRQGLRGWAEALLSPQRTDYGFYNRHLARARWREHVSGRRSWAYPLWNVLMLEAWLDEWG